MSENITPTKTAFLRTRKGLITLVGAALILLIVGCAAFLIAQKVQYNTALAAYQTASEQLKNALAGQDDAAAAQAAAYEKATGQLAPADGIAADGKPYFAADAYTAFTDALAALHAVADEPTLVDSLDMTVPK